MESASVNAEHPQAFAPAPPLAGEGAPALLVAVLAVMGVMLAAVSASMWRTPPLATAPEPVTIVVREKAPPAPPPPAIVLAPSPAPAPAWEALLTPPPAAPPPCFDPVTLLFARGSAVPLAKSDADIARLHDWLDHHANARLLVEGHADPHGKEARNLVLSFARAKSVASILAAKGIPASRIGVRAAGAAEAAANMDAHNRRAIVGIEGISACHSAIGATEHP